MDLSLILNKFEQKKNLGNNIFYTVLDTNDILYRIPFIVLDVCVVS